MTYKVTTELSSARVEGYRAEGADISNRAIVKAGTTEDLRLLCDAATDVPLGVVYSGGYQNKGITVIEKGDAEVNCSGTAEVGEYAILHTDGQTIKSYEQNKSYTDTEVIVLGKFKTKVVSGDTVAVVDVDCKKIPNPYKTKEFVINLGGVSGTTEFHVFRADTICTVKAARLINSSDVTANDTNYWVANLINKESGSGTDELLIVAADVNSTKATGGSGLTAYTVRSFALHATNVVLAVGDVLVWKLTKAASATALTATSLILDVAY